MLKSLPSIFESASRKKLRFRTRRGQIGTEDLWGLSITSLDKIGRTIKLDMQSDAQSLVGTPSKDKELNELRLKIVKHIIEDKQNKGKSVPVDTSGTQEPEEEIL